MTEWCLVGTHHCWYLDALRGTLICWLGVLLIIAVCHAVRQFIK